MDSYSTATRLHQAVNDTVLRFCNDRLGGEADPLFLASIELSSSAVEVLDTLMTLPSTSRKARRALNQLRREGEMLDRGSHSKATQDFQIKLLRSVEAILQSSYDGGGLRAQGGTTSNGYRSDFERSREQLIARVSASRGTKLDELRECMARARQEARAHGFELVHQEGSKPMFDHQNLFKQVARYDSVESESEQCRDGGGIEEGSEFSIQANKVLQPGVETLVARIETAVAATAQAEAARSVEKVAERTKMPTANRGAAAKPRGPNIQQSQPGEAPVSVHSKDNADDEADAWEVVSEISDSEDEREEGDFVVV